MAWWDNKMGACEARVCAFVGGELVRHRVLLWGVCMGYAKQDKERRIDVRAS